MTRINAGIPVKELNYKHLIAEHREIVRPVSLAKKRKDFSDVPNQFTLGAGHVKFFYTRLGYLKKRYEEIYKECVDRGFNVTYFGTAWDQVPDKLMNDWVPTQRDADIVRARIQERLSQKT